MRAALLCDVDQTVYHVGDEAIWTASAAQLASRGVDVVRVSRGEKHGPGGTPDPGSIPALTFPWPLEDRERYLAEIRAVLAGDRGALPAQDKLFTIIDALREVDAVIIGGGGALTSRFGWLLDERLATALVARSLGLPVILSGQSIGPLLTPQDRRSIGELLDLCDLVGVRDAASRAIARRLRPEHPGIMRCLDDATGLELPEAHEEVISVTLGSDTSPFDRDEHVRVMARVVDGLADRTGARIDLVPHMADPDEGGADLDILTELAAALRHDARRLPIERDLDSARRTASARWVVTTRFHPLVFGAMGGAGVLAIPLNRYGRGRMEGALENLGLPGASVPFAALRDPSTGGVDEEVLEALLHRELEHAEDRRAHLRTAARAAREASGRWWDRIVRTIAERPAAGIDSRPPSRTASPSAPSADISVPHPADAVPDVAAWTAPTGPALRAALAATDGSDPAVPAVSIVMRTRDRPTMLDRAVQDVLEQSRTDWELLVVDDAGDSRAVDEVLDRYRDEGGARIRVLHRSSSTGMESASNAGVEATSAPLLGIHDDDDTWHGTFLQETVSHLGRREDQDAVAVRTLIVHEREVSGGFVEDLVIPLWPELSGVHLIDMMAVNRTLPISILYRRSAHDAVGRYDESLPVVGDYDFFLRLLTRGEIGFIDQPLAQWRLRPGAAGASSNSLFAQDMAHRRHDRELRDDQLRRYIDEHGAGLPMLIARQSMEDTERILAAIGELSARWERVEEMLAGETERSADAGPGDPIDPDVPSDPVSPGTAVSAARRGAGALYRRTERAGRRLLRRRPGEG